MTDIFVPGVGTITWGGSNSGDAQQIANTFFGGGVNFGSTVPTVTPVTPAYSPELAANALYGKRMVLFAGGYARIGSATAPIVGPYLSGGFGSFIVSFGVPANPEGDRKIYKIWLDNELAWESASGGTLPAHGTFAAEAFDFEFKPGRLDQAVLSLEADHYPLAERNAYRPQMLLQILNIQTARFVEKTGKPIPYVACDIGDVTDGADPFDGLNFGEAHERIAYSPWAGYTSSTFVSDGCTDVIPGILIKDNFSIVDLCQSDTRIYRNIDLLQSDKLYLRDRGTTVEPDIVFNRDTIVGGSNAVSITRTDASAIPRELELGTIDPDQDYTYVTSLSKRPRDPLVVSASAGKDTVTLPIIMDSSIRQAMVAFAHTADEVARKKIEFQSMAHGYEVEPGDLIAMTIEVDGIDNEIYKVTETDHGPNLVVGIKAEAILRCSIFGDDADPFLPYVALLLGFNGNMTDESPSLHGSATAISGAGLTSSAIFGSGSLYLNGDSTQGVYFPDDDDWRLSTSNSDEFCVEMWVEYIDTLGHASIKDSTLIGVWGGGAPITSWMLYINTTGNGELTFLAEDSTGTPWTSVPLSSGLSWSFLTKYYVRVDKDATGKVRIYRAAFGDATAPMIGSATPTDSSLSNETGSGASLTIGCDSIAGGRTFPGLVDEVRITIGSSRYASDSGVVVPTTAFPRT